MTATILPPTQSTAWLDEISDDLKRVENKMKTTAMMGDKRLDGAIQSIITAGGKRIRPAIALLMGRLFGASDDDMLAVAASIELLHTATLVHDDLIDAAPERRGVPTMHSQLPIGITVLTGDFMFARAAALAAEANNVRVVKLFAETLVQICQGEILQAQTRWQLPTHQIYEDRIYGKTAALFVAASASSAILGGASEDQINAMTRYGRSLGLAFQIVDDALDFDSNTQTLGKPAANDMRQGIFNLPVMFYAQKVGISDEQLTERIENNDQVDNLIQDIRQQGMVEQSLEVARRHIRSAAETLTYAPRNNYTERLQNLTDYALERAY